MKRMIGLLGLMASIAFSNVTSAGQQEAILWLSQQQSASGPVYLAADIANNNQSTQEAALSLQRGDGNFTAQIARAAAFLDNEPLARSSTESISRRIVLKAATGLALDQDVQTLISHRHPGGGYGDYDDFAPNTLNTSFALSALSAVGVPADGATIDYLLSQQQTNGSWLFPSDGVASTILTAYALNALWAYRSQVNVDQSLNSAQAYLESQQQAATNLWGDIEASAIALIALVQKATDRSSLRGAIEALLAQQLSNGSFENDVYLTALMARLIELSERPAEDAISLSARVLDADSGFPLPNVEVRLTGALTAQSTTNSSGHFSVQVPVAGSYTLRLNLSGYSEAMLQTNLQVGEQRNLNDVVLTRLTVDPVSGEPIATASIRGTVYASIDGSPLSGALVTVNGQAALSATSDINGQYLIGNVPAGNLSLLASLEGYQPQLESVELAATQTLIFSPRLTKAVPDAVTVFGVATDAASGAVLVGTTVSVNQDGSTFNAITDSSGAYQITNIPGGLIEFSASLGGYQALSGVLDAPEGANVNFSPALTLDGDRPAVNTGALKTLLLDRDTGRALSNGSVTLTYAESGQVLTFSTNSGGEFEATGLALGAVSLEFSATDYVTETLNLEILDSVTFDLGIVSLAPLNTTTAFSVSGVVVNSVTGDALSDVSVTVGSQTLSTGVDGGFDVLNLAAGRVDLSFEKEGFQTVNLSVLLSNSQNLDLAQIRLRPEQVQTLFPDLTMTNLDRQGVTTDLQSNAISGELLVDYSNTGTQRVDSVVHLQAFSDVNANHELDLEVDRLLGEAVLSAGVAVGEAATVAIPIAGHLNFREAPIHLKIDSNSVVVESDEANNVVSTSDFCNADALCSSQEIPIGKAKVKWAWTGSDIAPDFRHVAMTPLVAQTNDDNQDGQINTDDVPDVIFSAFSPTSQTPGFASGIIRVISGVDGSELMVINHLGVVINALGGMAVGDIDNDNEIEILAPSKDSGVYAFELDGSLKWYQPNIPHLRWGGITLADLDGNGTTEILAAGAVLDSDGNVLWRSNRFQGQIYRDGQWRGGIPIAADIDLDGAQEVIFGGSVFELDGSLLWESSTAPDGLSGIGNFDTDNNPEVVVVRRGFVNLLDHDGSLLWRVATPDGGEGGPPTIADFDGDGNTDIGVAGSTLYTAYRGDGSILWTSPIIDVSSRSTGSTLFDFNNDGIPEIVYGDQKDVHVFDGRTGATVFTQPNSTATTYENPVIVDIDNDGSAEIIVAQNDAIPSAIVSPVSFHGIRVFEEENDSWVGTRGIWNQHAYSIDNVNDDGTIPADPVKGWLTHNTFRLNAFPQCQAGDPTEKWHWQDSSLAPSFTQVATTPLVAQLTDDNDDGLINDLDTTDVIFTSHSRVTNNIEVGILRAISGADGSDIWAATETSQRVTGTMPPGLADIDGDGLIEIVVGGPSGDGLLAFEHDGTLKWKNPGIRDARASTPAIADIDHDGDVEIIYGARVISAEGVVEWSMGNGFFDTLPLVVDLDNQGGLEIISGDRAFDNQGNLLWDLNLPKLSGSFWGTGVWSAVGNFDDDDFPELAMVVFRGPTRVAHLYIIEHDGQIKVGPINIPSFGGGAPTLGDFDGDNEIEIGIAAASNYSVFETDGSLKWSIPTRDASSAFTGSSAFDFEDDGKVEILYADELYFRILDGATGRVLSQISNSSRTGFEYPVVVDIDNDRHAEVLVVANDGQTPINRGIRLFESANDSWANTRRIWNQHTYHITNINDDGTVPLNEEPSWLSHNSYRLNTFIGRSASAQSDLTLSGLKIQENGIGNPFTLSARIGNGGALASGPGLEVRFYNGNPGSAGQLLATRPLNALAEGEFTDVSATGVIGLAAGDRLYAVVDFVGNLEECDETNNSMSINVGAINGSIDIKTDKLSYTANDSVTITNRAHNTSHFSHAYTAFTKIEDASGQLVAELSAQATGLLHSGAALDLPLNWGTATTLSGVYTAVAVLEDQNGTAIAEDRTNFTIVPTEGEGVSNVTLRTTTDRSQYHVNDAVEIDDLVQNISVNGLEHGTRLMVSVLAPNGSEVFNKISTTGDLTPGYSNRHIDLLSLSGAELGSYEVIGTVLSATDSVLATDSTTFVVSNNLGFAITGQVQVSADEVFIGETLLCSDTLVNTGGLGIASLEVRQLLLNIGTAELLLGNATNASIADNADLALEPRSIDTSGLTVGHYSCSLQVFIEDQWVTLDTGFFEVLEQTIQIELSASVGEKGRVLILLDDASHCTDEPWGPYHAPDLVAQQQLLESVLDNAGWSYTIVSNTPDFLKELRSGGYSIYLLMSELSRIEHFAQKEIREAVYRGEGLIEAGKALPSYAVINQAHGIVYRGQEARASGLTLFDSDLANADNVTFTHRDKNVRITAHSAQTLAEYLGGQGSQSHSHQGRHHHGHRFMPRYDARWCPSLHQSSAAITLNQFGLGKSIYVGFDLLMQATSLGSEESVFTEFLLNALDTVKPQPPLISIGSDYPVVFSINNLGAATTGRFVLPIPETLSVVDIGEGVIDEATQSVVWTLDMAAGETLDIPVWFAMPESAVTVSGVVESGSEPNFTERAQASIVLQPEPAISINAVIESTDKAYRLRGVRHKLKNAQWLLSKGRNEKALRALLLASNHVAGIQKHHQHENLTTEDLTTLRVNIDLLIKQVSKQIVVRGPRHRCAIRGQWRHSSPSGTARGCGHKPWGGGFGWGNNYPSQFEQPDGQQQEDGTEVIK